MPHFDSYESTPDEFADGFVETYGQQIEQVAVNGEETDDQKAARERFAVMAEALAWVLQHCWLGPGGAMRKPRAAFQRFVAVTMTVRPDLVGNLSFAAMARKLRTTKAGISKLSLNFADKAGLHFRRNRRQAARKKFSKVQKRVWVKRRRAVERVNGAHRPIPP